MSIKGSCLCGQVTYHCVGEPVMSGNCHCKDCQKVTGSAYAATMFVPQDAISIQGEVKFYENTADSGNKLERGFCPNCGSPLFGRSLSMPGLLAIRAGSLNDTSQYRPQADIYMDSAAPWDFVSPDAVTFPKMPPRG